MTLVPPITGFSGLSSQEAARRLRAEGPNELPSTRSRSVLSIALELIREPMLLLLLACGSIYLVLGNVHEAVILWAAILVIIGISLYQETKTERALEALRDLSSPRALVIRDGQYQRIPGREVIRGDWVMLAEGDRVPADGIVRKSANLLVNESLLTGESVPVRKTASINQASLNRPGGEDLPSVFAGTLIVQGHGTVEIIATGLRSEMGKIGKALQTVKPETTRVQRETARWVRVFAVIGILLCVVVAVIYGATRHSWLEGFLAGLALAISMVPEELPVILTVFLALGAWRISKHGVLTRRVPAVEMLGSTTVLCTDKTGTLTLNTMRVHQLFAGGDFIQSPNLAAQIAASPGSFSRLVIFSELASRADSFDPTEQAFQQLSAEADLQHPYRNWKPVHELPFSQGLMAMSRIWQSPENTQRVIAAKGAPEAIIQLCRFDPESAKRLEHTVHRMAAEGLRVLGVAFALLPALAVPSRQQDVPFEFAGLVGLVDPIRPDVPAAIQECKAAGIRVIMITGDYPETARFIARQIGLMPADAVITGSALEAMEEAALQENLRRVNLFARIVPEQKLRLVNALKANGEIVAMTGDGVNDAPALKAAHIGIAMGARGTDVAREAAALVLLNDDFSSLVSAVRSGRRIFDNMQKAMAYILAVHVSIAGMALLPVLIHAPLVLLPVHIVFLELIIDPACSVAFEAEEAESNIMRRSPKPVTEAMLNRRVVGLSLLQGISVLVTVSALFLIALKQGESETRMRALTFTTMVLANLNLIFANRSWTRTVAQTLRVPNAASWWIAASTLVFLAGVLYVPGLCGLFRLAPLRPGDVLLCLALSALGLLWFEALKLFRAGSVSRWR